MPHPNKRFGIGVGVNVGAPKGVGVIAQEMKEVLPEVVMDASSEDEFMSVSYGNIVGVLIEAIKELKAEIEELKGQNK